MLGKSWSGYLISFLLLASNIHLSVVILSLVIISDCRGFQLWGWTWWKDSYKGSNNNWWKNSVQELPNFSDAITESMSTRALLYLIPAAWSSWQPTIFWFFWNWWDFGRYCEEKVTKKSSIVGEHIYLLILKTNEFIRMD